MSHPLHNSVRIFLLPSLVGLLLFLLLLWCRPSTLWAQSNQSPQVSPIGDRTIYEGDRLQIPIIATDPDGDQILVRPEPASPLPSGATLTQSATGVPIVEFVPLQAGTFKFTLLVEDNGTPPAHTTVSFVVTVKAKPQAYVDIGIGLISTNSNTGDRKIHRGTQVDYYLDIANYGTVDAQAITVTIQLDRQLAFLEVLGGDRCTQQPTVDGKDVITCEIDKLNAQAHTQLSLQILPIEEGPARNLIQLETAADDLILYNNETRHLITVEPPLTDLALGSELRPDKADYQVGDEILLDLRIANLSQIATEYTLTTTLAPGLTLLNTEGGNAPPCQVNGQTILCRGTIGVNAVQYTIALNVAAQGSHPITVAVTSVTPDPDLTNNQFVIGVQTDVAMDLQVQLSLLDAQESYQIDEQIFVKLRVDLVQVTLPAILPRVTIDHKLAEGLAFVAVDTPADVTCSTSSGEITCTKLTMQTGEQFEVIITLRAAKAGTWQNSSYVTDSGTSTTDLNDANDLALITIVVTEPNADLAVTNELLPGTTDVGDEVRFRINVENRSDLPNLYRLTMALTGGLTSLGVESTPGVLCTTRVNEISCDDLIGPNSTISHILTVRIIDSGIQRVTAQVSSQIPDPDVNNNEAEDSLLALARGDIIVRLLLEDEQSEYDVGDLVFTAIQVEADAVWPQTIFRRIEVANQYPAGLVPVQVDEPPDVTCEIGLALREIVCKKSEMKVGEQFEVSVVFQAVADGPALDQAALAADNYLDSNVGNNQSQFTITIREPIIPYIYVHTFDDLNNNGRQDPGEPVLPGFKVDTTVRSELGERQDSGTTGGNGFVGIPVGESLELTKIQVAATFTATDILTSTLLTPTISLKVNSVPPTGVATVGGANGCGMIVYASDGNQLALACTEGNQLHWVNQANATVADFTAQLILPTMQVANRAEVSATTHRIVFEIDALEENLLYLPMIAND